MLNYKFITLFLLFNLISFSQKKEIDSINNLSRDIKTKNAKQLINVYLSNASKSKKLKYNLGEALCYSNLSLLNYYIGNYEKDIDFSLKAISVFKQIKSNENLAFEYGELGYRMKKRNMNKAIYYMQIGKKIAEQNNSTKALLSIYNNYGVLKEMIKEYDSSIYYYKKGLVLKTKLNDKLGIPYSLNNIAGAYLLKNQFSESEINFKKALLIRLQLNDTIGIAENYTYFGDLNLKQKKYSKAITFYKKGLEITTKHNYLDLSQYAFLKLSECSEKSNKLNDAFFYYKKHTSIKDSLLNFSTNEKISELEVQFDTKEKEKQLLEKEIENKKKSNWLILTFLISVFSIIFGYLFFRQQKLKNKQQSQEFQLKTAIASIETQNKLNEQRLSISRDLHDNIGAQLTFIISSVDNLKFGFPNMETKVASHLSKISTFTKETIVELRDTIWAMNTNEFTFSDLSSRIFNFIEKAKLAKEDLKFNFTIHDNVKTEQFSSLQGINIYRTIQEAVNNSIKYANASVIDINVTKPNEKIILEISDNGKGFDIENTMLGNGITNMKKRIEEINGSFIITSNTNGTKIYVEL